MRGVADVLRNFDNIIRDAEDCLELAVKAGALPIQNAAKIKAPKKTAHLARSIHTEVTEKTRERVMTRTGTNVIYAKIQEFGGIIKAKVAPYLVFRTDDGAWHSVKTVTIPPHPYLRPAYDENIKKSLDTIARVFKSAILKRRG